MKITQIADKIIVLLVDRAVNRNQGYMNLDSLCEVFPDFPREHVIMALQILDEDGLISALWSDDEPNDFQVLMKAVRTIQENTLLKRGYQFAKEIRQWF